ncbi:MAG TPA: cation diffusion facilitator family transporter [Bacillota bacterium]|nr:cation diffusion facilitator family transporter [Bacillota bacterium]
MSGEDTREDRFKAGESVSWRGMTANLALVAFKLVAGIIGRSSAMVADAAHSASDMLATFGVIVAFRISKRPADEDHPYGHGKAEPVAAKLVGAILIVAGSGIAVEAVRRIIARDFVRPGLIALMAAVASIIVKETMYQIAATTARRIRSSALMAEALHHRSDALSSVGTFAGILGGRLGLPILDPVAGFVVAMMIIWMGLKIIRASSDELMDAQTDPETVNAVRVAAVGVGGVCDVHSVVIRKYGGDSYVDLRIGVDPSISVVMGHEIAMQVESMIRLECPSVRGVLVHVDPESVHVDDPEGHPLPQLMPNGNEGTAQSMHGPNGQCTE